MSARAFVTLPRLCLGAAWFAGWWSHWGGGPTGVAVPVGWREQRQGWHGSEPLSLFLKPSLSTSARAGAASSSVGLARCCHRRCFSTAAGLSPDALLPPWQRCRPRYGIVPGHKRGMKSWEVGRPKLVSADRPLLTVPLLGLEVDEDFK